MGEAQTTQERALAAFLDGRGAAAETLYAAASEMGQHSAQLNAAWLSRRRREDGRQAAIAPLSLEAEAPSPAIDAPAIDAPAIDAPAIDAPPPVGGGGGRAPAGRAAERALLDVMAASEALGSGRAGELRRIAQASRLGVPQAARALARIHLDGDTFLGGKNPKLARRLVDGAQKRGDPEAAYMLAMMELSGEGAPEEAEGSAVNATAARELLQLLVDDGYEDAWPAWLMLLRLDAEALLAEGPHAVLSRLEESNDLIIATVLGLVLASVLLVHQLRSVEVARTREAERRRAREVASVAVGQ
jgi:TPR repeat protein